jgi:hypothetical protein
MAVVAAVAVVLVLSERLEHQQQVGMAALVQRLPSLVHRLLTQAVAVVVRTEMLERLELAVLEVAAMAEEGQQHQLMDRQILAVAAVAAVEFRMYPAATEQQAALALSSFLPLKQQLPPQALQQSRQAVAEPSTRSLLLAQLHSEVTHGALCTT